MVKKTKVETSSPKNEDLKDVYGDDFQLSGINPPDKSKGSAKTISSVLGEITWLMSMTPSHRHIFLCDLEWMVMPALLLNQYRIYTNNDGMPGGLVLWASVSEKVEKRFKSGAFKLTPDEWKSGDRCWIIDIVDPSGNAEEMIKDMKENVFKGKSFTFQKRSPQGLVELVTMD